LSGTERWAGWFERLAPEYGFEVRAKISSAENAGAKNLTKETLRGVDVAVNLRGPDVAVTNLRRLADAGIAVVCGTTGWFAELERVKEKINGNGSGLVWGANFSVGLNLFREIVAEAARRFAKEESYGAWDGRFITLRKGCAIRDATGIGGRHEKNGYGREISLSANRAGAVPGTHEIGFDSLEDTITIRIQHEAAKDSREGHCAQRIG